MKYLLVLLFLFGGNLMALEQATFAGGCFWSLQSAFETVEGIESSVVGYTGGTVENPTYHQVSSGTTGHVEAVQVNYDPDVISYDELVEFFWDQIDPTDPKGQQWDRGSQYQTAIFYHSAQQQAIAEASKQQLEESGRYIRPIVTNIHSLQEFYPAEDYHQHYLKKKAQN